MRMHESVKLYGGYCIGLVVVLSIAVTYFRFEHGIRGMSAMIFIILALGVLSLAACLQIYYQLRRIEDLPTSTIRSLAVGRSEIVGKAVAIKRMKAPFSQRAVVYSRYTVEKRVIGGEKDEFQTIVKGDVGDIFFLRDRTGQVLINPSRARFHFPVTWQHETRKQTKLPTHIAQFMRRIPSRNFTFGNTKRSLLQSSIIRLTELSIIPKQIYHVTARAELNPSATPTMIGPDRLQMSGKMEILHGTETTVRTRLRHRMNFTFVSGLTLLMYAAVFYAFFL
jgi:hypothetical protein